MSKRIAPHTRDEMLIGGVPNREGNISDHGGWNSASGAVKEIESMKVDRSLRSLTQCAVLL